MNQTLTWFEIAGDDMKYVRAEAKIDGKDTVEVSAPGVAAPRVFDQLLGPRLDGRNAIWLGTDVHHRPSGVG